MATIPESIPVDYDYFDRLLELKMCVGLWAVERKRLRANPADSGVQQRVAEVEQNVFRALAELDRAKPKRLNT